MKQQASSAIIWTDGSSHESHGGWAALVCLFYEDRVEKIPLTGYDYPTTNNRMEMQAVISGLEYIEPGMKVYVVADSNYVIKTLTLEWWKSWKDPAKTRPNWDLWEILIPLARDHEVEFVKVKGHDKVNGDHYNEVVDQMASEARKEGRECASVTQVSTDSSGS